MLNLPRGMRVFIDLRPFDMRGHFRSMAGRVRGFGLEPADGHVFLFVSRNRKMAAVFLFDGSGWCQYRKRLERGTFQLPDVTEGTAKVAVDGRVIASILDGIDLRACEGSGTSDDHIPVPDVQGTIRASRVTAAHSGDRMLLCPTTTSCGSSTARRTARWTLCAVR